MPILSNLLNAAGGGNIQHAQLALSATTTLSPLLKQNDWSNMQFNVISVPNSNILTSVTPSTSSFNLAAGTYKFDLYIHKNINAGSNSKTTWRYYNNTTSTALIPNALAYDYDNQGNTISPANYVTIPLPGIFLSQNSNLNLQVHTERVDVNFRYGVVWPTGTYSLGYLLDIYKIA